MSDVKKLDVKAVRPIHTGTTPSTGKTWTIFEVEALQADTKIQVNYPLRAFEELPLGIADYEVEKYERPGHPVSYTLKVPKGQREAHQARKNDSLEQRVEMLESNVEALRGMVIDLQRASKGQGPTPAPAGLGPQVVAPDPDPDDPIPF